jgi:membrane associated rhomboid family serine protease
MTEDTIIVALVAAVWAVLALLYAALPAFDMPGAAPVWGAGAALFALLAAAMAAAERKRR